MDTEKNATLEAERAALAKEKAELEALQAKYSPLRLTTRKTPSGVALEKVREDFKMAMDLVKQYKAEMDRAKAELAETQDAQSSIDTVAGLLRKELEEENERKAELLAKLASLQKMYELLLKFLFALLSFPSPFPNSS